MVNPESAIVVGCGGRLGNAAFAGFLGGSEVVTSWRRKVIRPPSAAYARRWAPDRIIQPNVWGYVQRAHGEMRVDWLEGHGVWWGIAAQIRLGG